MGKYQKFDEVPVWQEAARLYQKVLDVVEEANVPLSATFRNQLERASLCVSGSVAEGFDSANTGDLVSLLSMARGAAAEVQSMVSIVSDRPKVARVREPLQQIRASAEACARQLGAWKYAVENPGKRQQAQAQGQGQGASQATTRPVQNSGPNPNVGAPRGRI